MHACIPEHAAINFSNRTTHREAIYTYIHTYIRIHTYIHIYVYIHAYLNMLPSFSVIVPLTGKPFENSPSKVLPLANLHL